MPSGFRQGRGNPDGILTRCTARHTLARVCVYTSLCGRTPAPGARPDGAPAGYHPSPARQERAGSVTVSDREDRIRGLAARRLRLAYQVYFATLFGDPNPHRLDRARAQCRELHLVVYGNARMFPLPY